MRYRSLLLLSSVAMALNVSASDGSLSLADQQAITNAKTAISPTEESRKSGPALRSASVSGTATYIVQLNDKSAATYEGGISGYAATSPLATGEVRLNANKPEVKSYVNLLATKQKDLQEHCEQALGRKLNVKHKYQHAFNGIAMELTADEAAAIASLPEVAKVSEERVEYPQTDVGPKWIGAHKVWKNNNYPPMPNSESKGEGIVVAILDTGINSDHPSFADIGGDGYDHENPLGSGNYIPGSYCDTNPSFCNDKLIGAWGFVQGPDDPNSPEDSDGHGSHTASTVAGNVVKDATINAPTTSLMRKVSGVAPHANIIAYDVCTEGCPGSALLAAVEQVVIDSAALPNGIHSLNYSISGGESPWGDPVELGFLNATAAGIFVSASAGNSGPGASTVAHNSPWVSTVAAMTHNRSIENSLTDITSDGDGLGDIVAAGFTASYGPAAIVHAADYPTDNGSSNDTDPGQCLEPFPAGHFNGEIVMCDRGAIARTAKGANVLAGGAGGMVLGNLPANGDSVVADAHFLPAVHVGATDAAVLRTWLASNTNTTASISGASLNLDKSNGDVMASFSSRGPNLSADIVKPDIGAPGVSILAAVHSDESSTEPEYGFLSGTSMSSPHNAGAGALVAAIKPDWTPYEIKSAMMMTAKTKNTYKEDGVTPTDAFDLGAGRVDLRQIRNVGLVLDETPENFLAANPATGGDPKTLNIPSMKDSNCVGECSWTRTVRNVSGSFGYYQVKMKNADGVSYDVSPRHLFLGPDESADITVTANTTLAEPGWKFSELNLKPMGWRKEPKLHMPVVINPSTSTNANLVNKTVDKAEAQRRDILTYEISVTNGPVDGLIELTDVLPYNLKVVPGSLKQDVVNGSTLSDFSHKRGELTWAGMLDVGGLELSETASPFGYVPLSAFVDPFGCPEDNCDDGGVVLNVPAFKYNGEMYDQVVWSVNGTLEVGGASGAATTASARPLPDAGVPNNLLAPLWTDLNMGVNGDGAEWYVAVLNAGPDQFTVYEWNNLPLFGDETKRYTFQVWVQNGESGNIWFVYNQIDSAEPGATAVSVGVENDDGTIGDSYFYAGEGTAPTPGVDLKVEQLQGGVATFSFQAKVRTCFGRNKAIVNSVDVISNDTSDSAIAVTKCVRPNKNSGNLE